MRPFADRLFEAVQAKESAVVVGLDPNPKLMPPEVFTRGRGDASARTRLAAGVQAFLEEIIASVCDYAVAVKPQLAYFERLGPPGLSVYESVVRTARGFGLLVIADGKRNDIAETAEQYASAYLGPPFGTKRRGEGGDSDEGDSSGLLEAADLEGAPADALTVNPYLGSDGVDPFLSRREEGKGVFVLVKTSNPSSGQLQGLKTRGGTVAQVVADWVTRWSGERIGAFGYGDVGAVVGATYPQEMETLRARMPHAPFLLPGFGAQGGGAKDVAPGFDQKGLGAVVNASRSILYAYRTIDAPFGEAARRATIAMRDAILKVAPLL